jgi:hypothetical protein
MPRLYIAKTGRKNTSHKPQSLPAKFTPGFISDLDKRTDLAKALRVSYAQVVSDIGGREEVGHIKNALVERFCWLEAILQTLEHEMAQGQIDKAETLGKWIQAVNSLSGLARVLGIERRAKQLPWLAAPPAESHREVSEDEDSEDNRGVYCDCGTVDQAAELQDK